MDIRRTDLDGLATFYGEGPGIPQAWLVFRVGAADETLTTRGITQFVAGLATDDLKVGYAKEGEWSGHAAFGAFAGGPTTTFDFIGTTGQVTTLLRQVWDRLAAPDLDRFEAVREQWMLWTSWWRPSDADALLAERFGPRGIGLVGQPALGLHHLEQDAVLAWRDRFFNPANAALALKNLSPESLGLASREPGEPVPFPRTPERPLPLPGWYEEPRADDVLATSLLPGDAASDVFTATAVQRLRRTLGEAHDVDLLAVRMLPGFDQVVIRCTAPGSSAPLVRDAVVNALDGLAMDGPSDDEIAARHRRVQEWGAEPEGVIARIEWAAQGHFLGDAVPEGDPPRREEVAAAARRFLANAIYCLPPRVGMSLPYRAVPEATDEVVTGTTYANAGDPASGTLVVGEEGVSMTLDGRRVTTRFDACEAVARWADGTLDIYGSHGFIAQVTPKDWVDGDAAVAAILAGTRERVIAMRRPRT